LERDATGASLFFILGTDEKLHPGADVSKGFIQYPGGRYHSIDTFIYAEQFIDIEGTVSIIDITKVGDSLLVLP